MLAEKYEAIDDAATTIYQISEDERIRLQCEAREDYEKRQRSFAKRLKKLTEESEKKSEVIEKQDETIEQLKKRISELESQQKKS